MVTAKVGAAVRVEASFFATQRRAHSAATATAAIRRATTLTSVISQESFGLTTRSILVVGVFLHVQGSQTLGLVDERSFLLFAQLLPLRAETFAYLGVVHFRIVLGHLATLSARPHHERIHRPLHMIRSRASTAHQTTARARRCCCRYRRCHRGCLHHARYIRVMMMMRRDRWQMMMMLVMLLSRCCSCCGCGCGGQSRMWVVRVV